MLRLTLVFIVFELTVAHKLQLPIGVQPLSSEQIQRLESWTKDDEQNIWELSGQYQGDIVLTERQRNGLIDESYRWPNNEIPFEIDSGYDERQKAAILSALELYNRTAITPRPRTSSDLDYIYVAYEEGGCFSNVGRIGGRQLINLAPSCLIPGTIVHEFLHALGFYHQQSATERDDYVTINWENIQTGKEHNFNKYSANIITSFDEPYDYGSVMHYSRKAFSVSSKDTITPNDPDAYIGQREGFSEIDIRKLNKMYYSNENEFGTNDFTPYV